MLETNVLAKASPDLYRVSGPIILTLGEQIGMYMQRHYTIGFLLNRVLDRVEQLSMIAATFPEPLWIQSPPSMTMHTMRPYVIEEAADHAYWVAEKDTRLWRYRWLTHCGVLAFCVEVAPPQIITAGTRLELCGEIPPWCRPCQGCARYKRSRENV